jgi:hypothetical protein
MTDELHIARLRAENVKTLKVVDVTFDEEGGIVIRGGNGAGKSSVLDAIWFALGGKRAHDDDVIREGEDEARVALDLGQYHVERTWTENGTYLTVTDGPDGPEYNSPQSLLDDLVGEFAFDPLDFLRASASEQKAQLLDVTGHRDELEELDERYDERYEQRRNVNRTIRDKQGALEDVNVDESLADEELPSAADLVSDLEEAKERQRDKETYQSNAEQCRSRADEKRQQAEQLMQEAEEAIEDAEHFEAKANDIDVPDIDALEQKVTSVDERRARIEEAREVRAIREELASLETESEELTEQLESIEAERADILEASELPAGVGFSEGSVTFAGRPLAQAAMSEKLDVAMRVAMQEDPALRIVQVRDASLLDDANREQVIEAAEAAGFQVFLEMVGTEGPATIVMEDGEVVNEPKD